MNVQKVVEDIGSVHCEDPPPPPQKKKKKKKKKNPPKIPRPLLGKLMQSTEVQTWVMKKKTACIKNPGATFEERYLQHSLYQEMVYCAESALVHVDALVTLSSDEESRKCLNIVKKS